MAGVYPGLPVYLPLDLCPGLTFRETPSRGLVPTTGFCFVLYFEGWLLSPMPDRRAWLRDDGATMPLSQLQPAIEIQDFVIERLLVG